MRWNRGTMKLPHIKVEVEYREEETGAPGKSIAGAYLCGSRSALGLGLSLHVQRAVHPLPRSGFHAAAALRHLRRLPRRGVAAVRRVSEAGPPALRHARRTSAATARSRQVSVACATLLCMAGNAVLGGALGRTLLFVACRRGERRGIGHAAARASWRLLQRVRPAHHCAVRGAFHRGQRPGVRPHPRRERGSLRPPAPSSVWHLPFAGAALPEQVLRRSGGQAGVRRS